MPTKNSITTAVIGEEYGRLTVIGYGERNRHGQQHRICRCKCGAAAAVLPGHLRDGTTRSCGCLERDVLAARNDRRRGIRFHLGHPATYSSWRAMKYRCTCEGCRDYHKYGGRGIRVCERWRESYTAFLNDMGPRPARRTIDRIDVNGNYSCGKCEECEANGWPANCRWATARTQGNNKRSNIPVTRDGVTKTLAEWVRESGLMYNTVTRRLKYGWGIERALAEPAPKPKPRLITRNGVTKSLAEWVRATDLEYPTVLNRLRSGWDTERALTEPV